MTDILDEHGGAAPVGADDASGWARVCRLPDLTPGRGAAGARARISATSRSQRARAS